MADLGGPYPTPAPDFTDAADIIRALRLYHYGTESIPQNKSELAPESVAGYINNVLDRIDAVEQGVAAIVNLTSSQNLNDISSTGVFHGIPSISSSDQTSLNYPTSTTGILISYVANQTRYQMYQTSGSSDASEVYFRSTEYGTTTWSSWQQISKVGHTHNNLYYTINQINNRIDSSIGSSDAADKALITNSNGKIVPSTNITSTELGRLEGVTSDIQIQLNNKSDINHLHDDRYYQKTETARVFVQSTQPTGATNGDLWFY